MHTFLLFIWALFFLLGTFFLTAMNWALRTVQKRDFHVKALGKRFFYRYIHRYFFPEPEGEGIFFAGVCAQSITRFGYAAAIVLFLMGESFSVGMLLVSILGFIVVGFTIGEYISRLFGTQFPELSIRFFAFFASIFLTLAFPIVYVFLKVSDLLSRSVYLDSLNEPGAKVKQEIIEMIQEADVGPTLSLHDRKLIESVFTFRDKTAREVMVPRVDLFSLSAETSIKEAAKLLEEEGYSRVPVYRNTVDNIVGMLMYKDILEKYMEFEQKGNDQTILEAPIESIQKGALYTPEAKKISMLLQEFRKKQVHIAIVVDEYGGTEGIVTIEDILEEIVGEIADEYDEEEDLFTSLPDGSWVVDTRLSILDAEEQLGIKIPQEGDYDTVGGFIFHSSGTIPKQGFVIHRDTFEVEVLRSTDRNVEKARIRPIEQAAEAEPSEEA